MQPYLFPYLGYFALIKHTDKWVVFDTVQYINKGWINRNRILSQSKDGIAYLTVPVIKESRDMLIKDTCIDNSKQWKEKIIGQLAFYKKKAPFFFKVKEIVEDILNFETNYISELNTYALARVCEYLNIDFKYSVFSHDTLGIDAVDAPDEWALKISQKLGAKQYINPPGGKSFFDKKKYDAVGIDLNFLQIYLEEYDTFVPEFISGLSIIDVMMFNSSEEINKMLDNYELE